MGLFKEWITDYQWHFFTEEAQVFGLKGYLCIVTVNVMRSVVCCEMCEFFIFSKTTFAQLLTKIFQKGICVTFVLYPSPLDSRLLRCLVLLCFQDAVTS